MERGTCGVPLSQQTNATSQWAANLKPVALFGYAGWPVFLIAPCFFLAFVVTWQNKLQTECAALAILHRDNNRPLFAKPDAMGFDALAYQVIGRLILVRLDALGLVLDIRSTICSPLGFGSPVLCRPFAIISQAFLYRCNFLGAGL